MKSLQGFVLLLSVAGASAQFGGFFGDRFFGGGERAGGGAGFSGGQEFAGADDSLSFLDFADQSRFANDGFIRAQDGERTDVEAQQRSAARENVAGRDEFGDEVAAAQRVAVAESEDVKSFDEVDAAVGSSGFRKEGLQVFTDESFDRGEKVSFSDAAQSNAAVEAFGDDRVAASDQGASEFFGNSAARSADAVDGRAIRTDNVAAVDSSRGAQNSRLQANDVGNQRVGSRTNAFGETRGAFDVFGERGDVFGNNFFGFKRK